MVSKVIAFDFDGVICDGLAEYFHSSAIAHQEVWRNTAAQSALAAIRPAFYELRPVIETGWEMVALIQVLLEGIAPEAIWQDWQRVLAERLDDWSMGKDELMVVLDMVRDRQIKNNLEHWLSLHQFYDGMPVCLNQLLANESVEIYIITTKEARFIYQLLQPQNINFPQQNIFGKETKQPKSETLKQLLEKHQAEFWFIEDRLKTLDKIQQEPELADIKLFLATWGYNRFVMGESSPPQGIELVNLSIWQEKITQLLT